MPVHTIDDSNYAEYVQLAARDGEFGCLPRRSEIGEAEYCAVFADAVPLIPKDEWPGRIAAMAGRFPRALIEDTPIVSMSQNGLPYCWAWGLAQAMMAVRAQQGQDYIEFAPESLGAVVSFRKQGFYPERAIKWAAENGVCTRQYVPLHSINPSRYGDGWQENAKLHRPTEWFDLGGRDMWSETVTALLLGFPIYVGYNFWSHAVMLDELVIVNGEICVSGPNSWGRDQRFILKGSRKIPSQAFAPRTGTWSAQ